MRVEVVCSACVDLEFARIDDHPRYMIGYNKYLASFNNVSIQHRFNKARKYPPIVKRRADLLCLSMRQLRAWIQSRGLLKGGEAVMKHYSYIVATTP